MSNLIPPSASFWPTVIEQTNRGEARFDLPSRMLQERIIFAVGVIDDAMASSICMQLLFLESQNPKKEIAMYINSPGGVVTAGMAIYDTMQFVRPPISTLCIGQAASMGSLLLSAGNAWYALCACQCAHHGAPAFGRLLGPGQRYRASRRRYH